ncbi:type VI secretion protein IcmF/TssM N-terminal domain-containing protein [Roseateles sp.]|uniref:type VI secretion protein IcmF/TssM N-terminal domain-containing protein n=1 Tax=Roseateles sp. TaxID=1971397 RepID=UPI002E0BBE45|nr:type VI secretion protein IcmF/TssM N-terminal domain-containing protein [Roseateles sp.]
MTDNASPTPSQDAPSSGGLHPLLKAVLALLALLVLAAAIWFLGPLVSIGDMHPLGDVAVRVIVIGLLLAALLAWLLDWSARATWSVLGAAALSVLLWHGGPLLALGPVRPLAEVWQRLLAIGLLWLVLLVWGLYRLYRALQADEKLVQRWLHRESAQPMPAKDEIRALAATAREKVAQLREMHLTVAGRTGAVLRGLRRLVEGKRYLYELPWYVLIGQPGAGKSSVVLGSGLRFALGDQMGMAGTRMAPGHASGTGSCDWWLTNEAVLLDTAGRYTDAGDGERADDRSRRVNEAEWRGFLGVLRQVRPRAPINGAVVVVDTARLATDSPEQRLALAGQLRSRLQELRLHLGIRFPVYLVLAKADVLRGFETYFGSLTSEARAQVWGCTLPWNEGPAGRPPQDPAGQPPAPSVSELRAQLHAGFETLVRRVRDGLPTRLQEEFDLGRRQALYMLPQELAALEEPLLDLADAVFAPSRFSSPSPRAAGRRSSA